MLQNQINEVKKNFYTYLLLIKEMFGNLEQYAIQKGDDSLLKENLQKLEPESDDYEILLDKEISYLFASHQVLGKDLRHMLSILKCNPLLENLADLLASVSSQMLSLANNNIHISCPSFPDALSTLSEQYNQMSNDLQSEQGENIRLSLQKTTEAHQLIETSINFHLDLIRLQPDSLDNNFAIIVICQEMENILQHMSRILQEMHFAIEGKSIKHQKVNF